MRADIVPRGIFPNYELPDHTTWYSVISRCAWQPWPRAKCAGSANYKERIR
jgi:hypothetical protein